MYSRGMYSYLFFVLQLLTKGPCRLVFRWLAIPWIQAEIDDWMDHRNRSKPRADKNKILPHGIPDIIRAKPERYGSFDFKVRC
jgi:hypothetical protein